MGRWRRHVCLYVVLYLRDLGDGGVVKVRIEKRLLYLFYLFNVGLNMLQI